MKTDASYSHTQINLHNGEESGGNRQVKLILLEKNYSCFFFIIINIRKEFLGHVAHSEDKLLMTPTYRGCVYVVVISQLV